MVTLKLTNAQASLLISSMANTLDCFEKIQSDMIDSANNNDTDIDVSNIINTSQALIFLYDGVITRIGNALKDEGYKAPEKITKEDVQLYQGI